MAYLLISFSIHHRQSHGFQIVHPGINQRGVCQGAHMYHVLHPSLWSNLKWRHYHTNSTGNRNLLVPEYSGWTRSMAKTLIPHPLASTSHQISHEKGRQAIVFFRCDYYQHLVRNDQKYCIYVFDILYCNSACSVLNAEAGSPLATQVNT